MIQTTLGIAVSISGLLAALNLSKPRVSLADWWLFGWLSATAVAMLLFLAAYHANGTAALIASTLANSAIGCCPPFLFLYARSLTGQPVRRVWMHFMIPIGNIVFIATLGAAGALTAAKGAVVADVAAPVAALVALVPPMILLASGVYCWRAIRAINGRAARNKELGVSWADARDVKWVRRWAVASLVGYLGVGAVYGLGVFGQTDLETHVGVVLMIETGLIAYVGYSGLRETRYFRVDAGRPASMVPPSPTPVDWPDLEMTLRSAAVLDNPRTTPDEAARHAGVSKDALLLTIQTNSELTFFDLLNRFRVDRSKARLADPAYDGQSVLHIGLAAGFGSKSAFYAAFQQHAGMTPAAFRRKARAER